MEKELSSTQEELRQHNIQLNREKKNRDKLPQGFRFGYNDRRGEPNFDPYWYCELHNEAGKTVWSQKWTDGFIDYNKEMTEELAFSKALDLSWELMDIAEAVFYHRREEDF